MNMRGVAFAISILIAAMIPAHAKQAPVTRAYGDQYGAVHIIRSDGKETIIPKQRGAAGVDDVKIAPDGQTVGWLVDWPNPDKYREWETLPMTLVVWRKGRVVQRFSAASVFWGWAFWNGSEQVAYNVGGTHGWAGEYDLCDIATGRTIRNMYVDANADFDKLPDWVKAIDESGR